MIGYCSIATWRLKFTTFFAHIWWRAGGKSVRKNIIFFNKMFSLFGFDKEFYRRFYSLNLYNAVRFVVEFVCWINECMQSVHHLGCNIKTHYIFCKCALFYSGWNLLWYFLIISSRQEILFYIPNRQYVEQATWWNCECSISELF